MTQASALPADATQAAQTLRQSWQALLREEPKLRIREAAARLGVSEAELVATDCGHGVVRLQPDWGEILKAMPSLGRIMALTRNESVVHERYGRFEQVEVNGPMGLVLGPDIDLRLFLNQWRHGFAARQTLHSGTRNSLQFFDAQGNAILKIYLTEDSDAGAYQALVARWRSEDQAPTLVAEPAPAPAAERPDSEVDSAGLRAAWEALRDTHDFFALLKKFKVTRTQALRLVGDDLAWPVETGAVRQVLETAAARALPIMVFVGNRGGIQIHTGPVQNIKPMGPWLNVLDDDFNLHLREDHVAAAWVVRKPTDDGVVTSLELFDARGENLALIFGKRKPGIPESADWRALADELPRAERMS
ncbi:MAG TPA: ChuX/HutX family heme-like substrate-binding protein [Nevskiales bacterium]|nr:ChuX/HutX family heme-like substrate-binding protein [Nevskiales bacterium]